MCAVTVARLAARAVDAAATSWTNRALVAPGFSRESWRGGRGPRRRRGVATATQLRPLQAVTQMRSLLPPPRSSARTSHVPTRPHRCETRAALDDDVGAALGSGKSESPTSAASAWIPRQPVRARERVPSRVGAARSGTRFCAAPRGCRARERVPGPRLVRIRHQAGPILDEPRVRAQLGTLRLVLGSELRRHLHAGRDVISPRGHSADGSRRGRGCDVDIPS